MKAKAADRPIATKSIPISRPRASTRFLARVEPAPRARPFLVHTLPLRSRKPIH